MKPPSGPKKQTQFKACPERIEFTLSVIEGNGPISSQTKIACQKIRPHPQSRRQKEYLALRDLNVYPWYAKSHGS